MAIQFEVEIEDRPGALGRLAEVLGEASVNIDAIAGVAGGGRGYVVVLTDQVRLARRILKENGYTFEERTVLNVRLEDRPGTLSVLARRLGDAGINITSVVQVDRAGGTTDLAVGVDDAAKARGLV